MRLGRRRSRAVGVWVGPPGPLGDAVRVAQQPLAARSRGHGPRLEVVRRVLEVDVALGVGSAP